MFDVLKWTAELGIWGAVGALLGGIAIGLGIAQLRQSQSAADSRKAMLQSAFNDYESKYFIILYDLEKLQGFEKKSAENTPEGSALRNKINASGHELRSAAAILTEAFEAFGNSGNDGAASVQKSYSAMANLFNSKPGNLNDLQETVANIRVNIHKLCS